MSMSSRSMGDDNCCLICGGGTTTSRPFAFALDFALDLEFTSTFVTSDLDADDKINSWKKESTTKRCHYGNTEIKARTKYMEIK